MAIGIMVFYFICILFVSYIYYEFKDDAPEFVIVTNIIILVMGMFCDYLHSGWYLIKCLLQ